MNNTLEKEELISLEKFTEKVSQSLKESFEDEREIRISKVKKNNGIEHIGITCIKGTCNISPTLYMESFYDYYKCGNDFDEVMDKIKSTIKRAELNKNVDLSYFKDYDKVKDRIVYKLVNKSKNEKLLKEIPYVEYLDLAIIFYYMLDSNQFPDASILIYNSHLQMWDVNTETIYEDAKKNTQFLLEPVITNMADIMKEMILRNIKDRYKDYERIEEAEKAGKSKEAWMEDLANDMTSIFGTDEFEIPMLVLTNNKKQYGASCILYNEILDDIAGKEDTNFYIIPSSIHEVIIVPDNNDMCPDVLGTMIHEVNTTHVKTEEVLSDSLYYYDKAAKSLYIA